MDGSYPKQLVSTARPASSLTLDTEKKRLYWIEKHSESSKIVSTDLDGNDLKQIIPNNFYDPVGLTLYRDFFFWSDNKTG